MDLNIENFLSTLPMMLYGMLGIFTVIMVVYLCIKLLGRFFPEKGS